MIVSNSTEILWQEETHYLIRCGIGAVGRMLTAGEDVTVVLFGGSITWGGHASDIDMTSYSAHTTQWLRQQYPTSYITSINAGIGGVQVVAHSESDFKL